MSVNILARASETVEIGTMMTLTASASQIWYVRDCASGSAILGNIRYALQVSSGVLTQAFLLENVVEQVSTRHPLQDKI